MTFILEDKGTEINISWNLICNFNLQLNLRNDFTLLIIVMCEFT